MVDTVRPLETMPEIKAEKLIREHQAMLTALKSIRMMSLAGAKGDFGYSYSPYKQITAIINDTIGSN